MSRSRQFCILGSASPSCTWINSLADSSVYKSLALKLSLGPSIGKRIISGPFWRFWTASWRMVLLLWRSFEANCSAGCCRTACNTTCLSPCRSSEANCSAGCQPDSNFTVFAQHAKKVRSSYSWAKVAEVCTHWHILLVVRCVTPHGCMCHICSMSHCSSESGCFPHQMMQADFASLAITSTPHSLVVLHMAIQCASQNAESVEFHKLSVTFINTINGWVLIIKSELS